MNHDAKGDRLRAISRVYGPEAWKVYDLLDQSLEPRGPDMLLALATERLAEASTVLDVGCRDAAHLIEIVRSSGASGVGIDPVPHLVEQARAAVCEAGLADRVDVLEGVMGEIPFPDASFDLVWCRDVIELIEELDEGIAEMARVLGPDGRVILYTVVATDLLEPKEAALLGQSLAVVPANLVEERVEAAFARAGLEVEVKDVVGTEWREHAEERTQPGSRALLRLARLRRLRGRIVEEAGEEIYGHVESSLHWLVFLFLGKLVPIVYVLRKAR